MFKFDEQNDYRVTSLIKINLFVTGILMQNMKLIITK